MLAEGEAGIADLTDKVVVAGDQTDDLILAKTEFAKTILNFGGGAELLDANGDTGLDAAERTNLAMRLFAGVWLVRFAAHGQYSGRNDPNRTSPILRKVVPGLRKGPAVVEWVS